MQKYKNLVSVSNFLPKIFGALNFFMYLCSVKFHIAVQMLPPFTVT